MESTKTVYFIRHGESEANAAESNGRDIRDPALTERGCLQAAAWASVTSSWGVYRVLVSPLMRTLQTALLAFPSETPIYVKRCMREHGWHEDQNKGSPADELDARLRHLGLSIDRVRGFRRLASPHEFWDPANEGSLSREELHYRRKATTRHLERTLFSHSEGVLALVCHYHTIKHFVGASLHNCEAVRVEFQLRWTRWVVSSLCAVEMPMLPATLPPSVAPLAEPEQPGVPMAVVTLGVCDSENEQSVVAAQQSSGCEDEDAENEPMTQVDVLEVRASGTPVAIMELYARNQFKNASVLILGNSKQHETFAALLGGLPGRDGYRYCDFGGGLDGGSSRFGGKAHRLAERRWPHLGAFRELAEEFLGFHGDEARSCASCIWQACSERLIGGVPVQHRSHLLFLVPAPAILDAIANLDATRSPKRACKYWTDSRHSCRNGDYCKFSHGVLAPSPGLEGIDALAERFVPNSEVADVMLFSIDDLLTCIEPDTPMVNLLAPIWTSSRDGGRPRRYPKADQILVESAYQACDDRGVHMLGGRAVVRPVSMIHTSTRHGCKELCHVERLDRARIRRALAGPEGSLSSCAPLLRVAQSQSV